MEIKEYVRAIVLIVPPVIVLISGIVIWRLNEHSKRTYEDYKRKEEKYSELIKCLRGFYVRSSNEELKDEFLKQLNLSWLYCSDEVIHKAYEFLGMVHVDKQYPDGEKEKAVGELVLAMRKDLITRSRIKKTALKPEDFRILKVNRMR